MAENAAEQKTQYNWGLGSAVTIQKIRTRYEKLGADLMDAGFPKVNMKQLKIDEDEIFGAAIMKWLRTSLSLRQALNQATKDEARKRVTADINEVLRQFMLDIVKIIEEPVNEMLEEQYG